jgi:hypothetical protein
MIQLCLASKQASFSWPRLIACRAASRSAWWWYRWRSRRRWQCRLSQMISNVKFCRCRSGCRCGTRCGRSAAGCAERMRRARCGRSAAGCAKGVARGRYSVESFAESFRHPAPRCAGSFHNTVLLVKRASVTTERANTGSHHTDNSSHLVQCTIGWGTRMSQGDSEATSAVVVHAEKLIGCACMKQHVPACFGTARCDTSEL